MASGKILLVDDDPDDRIIFEEAMQTVQSDNVIQFAENGLQALAILKDCVKKGELPCLVVLDLNMPKMNGTETLQNIKRHDNLKSLQVVIYSTSLNDLEKEKCLLLGATDYIIKPISFLESNKVAKKILAICSAATGMNAG